MRTTKKNCIAAQLHAAINFNNLDLVTSIISSQDESNLRWKGLGAVSCAVYKKRYDILNVLIMKGANVNLITTDHKMEPPLFAACRLGDIEAVKILLKSPHININQKDFYHRTALWAAAKRPSLEIVKLLLDEGADITVLNMYEFFSCPRLQQSIMPSKIAHLKVVQLLIRRGCTLDFKNISTLAWSVKNEDADTFTLLVNAGCKVQNAECLKFENLPPNWQKDEALCKWIDSLLKSPCTLMDLSLQRIRQIIIQKYKNIAACHVIELQLPKLFEKAILLEI